MLPEWLALYYDRPIELTHGEGRHVWDAAGVRYLDFFGGILTTMTAHALPEVAKAVADQAGRIIHSSTLYLNRPMVELAELVGEVSGIPDAKVFFTNSGAEAVEAAFKLSRSTGRRHIVATRGAFHGRTMGALALTGQPAKSDPFRPLPGDVTHIPYGDVAALEAEQDWRAADQPEHPLTLDLRRRRPRAWGRR